MTVHQSSITIKTSGRNTYDITNQLDVIIQSSPVSVGLCHIFLHHTSASLIITENADPDVRRDLETIIQRLSPDADPDYYHTMEGDDDMSAHGRNMLTHTEMTIPITNNRLALGTWQGLFLWEHREGSFSRKITITIMG